MQTRRRFLANASVAAGCTFGLLSGSPAQAEAPPEVSRIRIAEFLPTSCDPPLFYAEDALKAEGFSEVVYQPTGDDDPFQLLADDKLDLHWDFAPTNISALDAGLPVKLLGGIHSGCLELIANDQIKSVSDLKGKRVGLLPLPHIWVSLMAAYVGLDPHRDIEWVTDEKAPVKQLFIDGKIDAFLAGPPEAQEMRARKVGQTIVNISTDAPWSQYFCCFLATGAAFAANNPVATKRAMRAILKSIDFCVSQPEQVARRLMERKFAENYDYTLQAIRDIGFDRWRDYDSADAIRFYALRMRETGFIKSSPQTILERGADWRFLEELKRELKT
jgi:NitT/TauT family transport system substrate-binding protein